MSHVVITYFLFSQVIVVQFMKLETHQGKQGLQRYIPLHNQVAENGMNAEGCKEHGNHSCSLFVFPLSPASNSVWYLGNLCIEQKP